MPHRTFIAFLWPSALAMLLFIALPIMSVAMQSFFISHEQVLEVVENCGPFGCTESTQVNQEATARLQEEEPLGRFNGLAPTPTAIIWPSRKSARSGGQVTGRGHSFPA